MSRRTPRYTAIWALSTSVALSACYRSHSVEPEERDGGTGDVFVAEDAPIVPADADARCVSPERCGVWVGVAWQADFPAGAIDRVVFLSDMNCTAGVLGESTSLIGPSVSPMDPRNFSRTNVCSGCFFVSARALDAEGRELARGREDFCVETTRNVVLTLR